MGKLVAIVSVPVFVAALAGGLAFSLGGSSADPASAEGDGWEAMHDDDGMMGGIMRGMHGGHDH